MSPWETLGLSATIDVREIKRAYAKRLKLTKPDEKPAEFQLLHEAYRSALYHAANSDVCDAEVSEEGEKDHTEDAVDSSRLLVAESVQSPEGSAPPSIGVNQFVESDSHEKDLNEAAEMRRKEYEELIARVESLLGGKVLREDLKQWHFISASPYILEDHFNWHLGKQIFKMCAEYEQQRVRGSGGRYRYKSLPYGLAHYFDQLFAWRENAYYLESEFGEGLCRALLTRIDEPLVLQSPLQGLRGGVLVRGHGTASARPTETKVRDYRGLVVSLLQAAFFMLAILNALRHCSSNF
ncbi:J domain-containing protein [Cellvibrio sp. OA-2007]|uniref:J domain-containing protein n=1 Tax=Cellvibrio sp. OA-2007 TaxID=529823 RepID=UPI0007858626|nr:J domain-containing protein [Cellvibrio sp. OA-2007]